MLPSLSYASRCRGIFTQLADTGEISGGQLSVKVSGALTGFEGKMLEVARCRVSRAGAESYRRQAVRCSGYSRHAAVYLPV